MPYLLQAALQVGLIGAPVGTTAFASMYTLLPRFRLRSHVSGWSAGSCVSELADAPAEERH